MIANFLVFKMPKLFYEIGYAGIWLLAFIKLTPGKLFLLLLLHKTVIPHHKGSYSIFQVLHKNLIYKHFCNISSVFFLLFALLRNFFLCKDCWRGDVPPHFAQPCFIGTHIDK